MEVDDPVHQMKTGEANGENNSRIFVDGRRRSAHHDVQILALTDQRQVIRVSHGRHLHHRAATRFVVFALQFEKNLKIEFKFPGFFLLNQILSYV